MAETTSKLLVIDDDLEVSAMLSDFLQASGYSVIVTHNGYDGIEAAFSTRPHIIICDSSMPGISGAEVLRAIRENPSTTNTPFISMTGSPESMSGVHKPDAHLQKPFFLEEALALIERLLAETKRCSDSLNLKSPLTAPPRTDGEKPNEQRRLR